MSLPLLSTKFYLPPPRANAVPRPRLTEKLRGVLDRPGGVALLSGPAGFGKTTLLSEFLTQTPLPAAWLSLDEGDNDPVRFWTYLIRACQSVQAGVGEAALALFHAPQPPPDEAVPTLLINDLARLEGGLALVLDDFHTLQEASIHSAFALLVERLPANLRLIVSTRLDPPWPLARLRARDRLVEIRSQDLRFNSEETAAFLIQSMGLELSPEDVAALEERSEGWVAGLQLAAIALQSLALTLPETPAASFVKAFTGSHVFIAEYLVEEVLKRQPDQMQAFLLQTSILERMCGGLCEAVTGCQDGGAILAGLHRANLFAIPLDGEGKWFRYHRLFADLLQARLQQAVEEETILDLHRRAAGWYAQSGMHAEAIQHALAARDYALALEIIEPIALPMILQAYVRTVEAWLQAIPQVYLEEDPRVNMAFAWMNLLRGAFDQATPYIERLERTFSVPEGRALKPSLQGEWLAIQSKLLSVQGKPAESRDLAVQALQILPREEAHVRSILLVNLATAYAQLLDYGRAAETFRIIVDEAQAAGDFVSEILGSSGRAQMVLQQGRLRLAFEIASQEIQRLEAFGKTIPFSATLYGELGQIYYYWKVLDQSQSYLQRSMQTSGQSGYSDPEIYLHVIRSRIAQMEGDWARARQEMEQAGELARSIPPAMIREEIISQQARVDLATGRIMEAQALLEAEGFAFEGGLRFPPLPRGGNVMHPQGLLYNSALRLLLYRSGAGKRLAELEQGLELSGSVLAGELQCRHIPVALETLLLRSQIYAALGEAQESLDDVCTALELAEPEGFISPFVEAGPPIAAALARLLQRNLPATIQPEYIREIRAAFPKTSAIEEEGAALSPPSVRDVAALDESLAPIEPLTAREREVLQLIAAGDSNRAIAEKLVITLSAVKKHTGNIYGKLSVNSRTQAVARARQLGWLPANG